MGLASQYGPRLVETADLGLAMSDVVLYTEDRTISIDPQSYTNNLGFKTGLVRI